MASGKSSPILPQENNNTSSSLSLLLLLLFLLALKEKKPATGQENCKPLKFSNFGKKDFYGFITRKHERRLLFSFFLACIYLRILAKLRSLVRSFVYC